jgi:adenylate kinase
VNVVEKKLIAVHIMLDREVTIQKLLGRRLCKTCAKSFNTAHIVERGFDMPAILPDQKTCQFTRGNQKCEPIFERRDDDTAQVIEKRLEDFDARNNCILEFYRERNALRSFEVKKGVKDVDSLWKAMSQ